MTVTTVSAGLSGAQHLQFPPGSGVGVRHPHHAHVDDLSGGLHGDALELAQTVLKLCRSVAGLKQDEDKRI